MKRHNNRAVAELAATVECLERELAGLRAQLAVGIVTRSITITADDGRSLTRVLPGSIELSNAGGETGATFVRLAAEPNSATVHVAAGVSGTAETEDPEVFAWLCATAEPGIAPEAGVEGYAASGVTFGLVVHNDAQDAVGPSQTPQTIDRAA